MGSRIFVYLRYCLALILSVFSIAVAAQVEHVNNLRLWYSPDRTRIVFDVSAHVNYKTFLLSAPSRLVVDFAETDLQAVLPELDVDNKHILAIRTGQPSDGTLRFVFELKKQLVLKSFVLTPNELYGHRLVVDLNDSDYTKTENSSSAIESDVSEPALSEIVSPVLVASEQRVERTPSVLQTTAVARELIVAIDAGHGGEDPGALGHRGSKEKKLTLAIAKKLKKAIDKHPNMRAVLIRNGDYFIELHKRRMNARNLDADIFVSIHADAFTKPSANGFSVFALSQRGATSAMARALAAKENAADLIGGVSLADKDQVLAQVLVDLSMTNTISESVNLGGRVLKELSKLGRLHSSRVEQAGFAVLKSPDMPSILIETGFITNPKEEKNLRSSSYQEKLANAIYTAIDGYYQQTPYFSNSSYASPAVTASNSSVASSKGSQVHIVGRGDSISKISAKYNVTISALKRFNKLKRDTVYIGQKIKLPASAKVISQGPQYHRVKRGDTLSEIANKYNVSMTQIMRVNKLRSGKILLGQRLKIPSS